MDDVQLQLAQKRIFKSACVALCGVDTDKNFAVLKSQQSVGPDCPRNFRCKSAIRRSEINQMKISFSLRKSVRFRGCNCKECCRALPANSSSSATLTEIFRCKLRTVISGTLILETREEVVTIAATRTKKQSEMFRFAQHDIVRHTGGLCSD